MFNIRVANKDDVGVLQNLNHEVFVDNQKYDDDLDMDWALSEKGKNYFTKLLSKSNNCCLIAEFAGKPVGYIAAAPKQIEYRKSKYFEIDNIGVILEFRSNGIGSMLIENCVAWARAKGFQKIYVNAYFNNKKAIAFYQKNGLQEIDVSLERKI